MFRTQRTGAGFTLVELLIVIGIITVLAGLLLPVLTGVYHTAQGAFCGNNLRQLGQAHVHYLNANSEWVISPYAENEVGGWLNWFYNNLVEREERILRCPGLPAGSWFDPPGGRGVYAAVPAATYLMNACKAGTGANGWDESSIADRERSYGWTAGLFGSSQYALPIKLAWAANTSARIMVVESSATFSRLSPLSRSNAGKYVGRYRQTDHGLPIDGASYAGYRKVGAHHNGAFGVLMGDSSSRTMGRSEDEMWAAWRR